MGRTEEEEALAFADSCGNNISGSNYYVQSPCSSSVISLSHATTHGTDHQLLLLPYHRSQSNSNSNNDLPEEDDEYAKTKSSSIHLSRCLSSRASVDQLLHQNKKIPNKLQLGMGIVLAEENEDQDEIIEDLGSGWWRYFSIKTYPHSSLWIFLQLSWRLLFSITAALLVFYIATKPPPPHVSVQVSGVKQFELAEGVDSSGVATNFLSCNISMTLVIDNKSQVFSLAILYPLLLDIYFGRLPLVFSHQMNEKQVMIIKAHEREGIKLEAGTTTKAMYGGGRNMEDMLKSGKGLPLLIHLSFSSHYHYRLIGWLFRPTFHHHAHCILFLFNPDSNSKHGFRAHYNSTCSFLSS